MRIAVTGAAGQLGAELCRQLGDAAIPLNHEALDLAHGPGIITTLADLHPDVVINCAAYTQVDRAEEEPDLCRKINAAAVENLASACKVSGSLLVQISTDYVFGEPPARRRPWCENDSPSPQGVYARSKLAGERAAARCPRHLIVRTCGLYARPTDARAAHFVKTMLRLGGSRPEVRVVADQHCTPTYVPHLARGILWLAGHTSGHPAPSGIYHVTNTGHTTWHAFAVEIFRQAGMSVKVQAISTAEYGAKAARPPYSVLDTSRYHMLGGPPMPDWRAALVEYFAEAAGRVLRADSMQTPAPTPGAGLRAAEP